MLFEDENVIPSDLIIYCDLTKLCPYLKFFQNTNLMFTKWLFHSPSNIEHVYLLYIGVPIPIPNSGIPVLNTIPNSGIENREIPVF